MEKQNVKRIAVLMIITVLATVFAVGCGDGKGKRRQRTNKVLDNGKPAADGKKSGGNTTGGTGTPTTPATGDGGATTTDQGADQAKAAATREIEDALKAASEAGTTISKNALEDGKYKLKTIVSAVQYIFKTEDARALQTSQLVEQPNGDIVLNATENLKVGAIADHQIAARQIEIAYQFEVKKENNVFAAVRTSFSPLLMNTSLNAQNMTITTGLANSSVDASPIASSTIDMLQKTAQGATDITYSMNDENNRLIVMRIRKVSETEIRVTLKIEEAKMSDTDANSEAVVRDIVLIYTFEKAVAQAAEEDLTLTQPASPTEPPAPATDAGAAAGADDDLANRSNGSFGH